MQNKTIASFFSLPQNRTYPTLPNGASKEEGGILKLWSDDRYSGTPEGPSSPVCSVCPSCPALPASSKEASPPLCNKTLGMLVTKRKSPKWQSIGINLCATLINEYHGVTSTRQHQASHYIMVSNIYQASLTSVLKHPSIIHQILPYPTLSYPSTSSVHCMSCRCSARMRTTRPVLRRQE
jgi:hypothetical protein